MARGVQQRKTDGREGRGESGGGGGRQGPVGKTGGAHADGVSGGRDGGGGQVADRGAHPEMEERVQRDWVGRGHVEGSGGNITWSAHDSDNLPRRAGRGTGTATLEAKLLQQLAAMREEVLYVIFLDLTKAYDPWTGQGVWRS